MISLKGTCDLHIHSGPDVGDRLANDVETATICRDAGMRAIVFKCHFDTTMTRAWHTQQQVEGIRVFGGITLNANVGGINPAAVDFALRMGAAEVWMPSSHSKDNLLVTGEMGGYKVKDGTPVSSYPVQPVSVLGEDGRITAETYAVLELIHRHNAIVGTSHLGSKEALLLIQAARDVGCQKVVLTHPFYAVPGCTVEQVKEAVDLGAYVEFCAGNALSPLPRAISLSLYLETIEKIGCENIVIASDAGHPRKTYPPETIRMFAEILKHKGVPEKELYKMMIANYDKLLNLEPYQI